MVSTSPRLLLLTIRLGHTLLQRVRFYQKVASNDSKVFGSEKQQKDDDVNGEKGFFRKDSFEISLWKGVFEKESFRCLSSDQ